MTAFTPAPPPHARFCLPFAETWCIIYNMYRILRIVCSVISAAAVAACIFIFVYLGAMWGVITLVGAAAFFGLTLLFRSLQIKEEMKDNPPPTKGDFITGKRNDDCE